MALGDLPTRHGHHAAATPAHGPIIPTAEALMGGRYRIIRQLGAGGQGTVYEVHDERADERFALKWLPWVRTEEDQARLEREVRAAQRVRCAEIVTVIGGIESEPTFGGYFLLMELLIGEPLSSHVEARARGGAPDIALAERVAKDLGAALTALHEAKIVHRDLKPSNVFVCRDGSLKLLDLGLARGLDDAHSMTVGAGTAAYAAPEQLAGRAGAASDQYGLAATLYALLTGKLPAGGAVLVAPPSSIDARIGAAWDAVLKRACHPEPERRFPNIVEFVRTLTGPDERRPTISDSRPDRPDPAASTPRVFAQQEAAWKTEAEQFARDAAKKRAREETKRLAAERAAREETARRAEGDAAETTASERRKQRSASRAKFWWSRSTRARALSLAGWIVLVYLQSLLIWATRSSTDFEVTLIVSFVIIDLALLVRRLTRRAE